MPELWLLDTNILLRMFRPEDSRYDEISKRSMSSSAARRSF